MLIINFNNIITRNPKIKLRFYEIIFFLKLHKINQNLKFYYYFILLILYYYLYIIIIILIL